MILKNKFSRLHIIVDLFFCIGIIICCGVMIYAVIVFAKNCAYTNFSTSKLADQFILSNTNSENDTASKQYKDTQQKTYNEQLIAYATKLQELENNSTSTNLMTFLYTFLSGTLIGVAIYFSRKCQDSFQQISVNTELISNLDSQILFSNFYMHARHSYSTIQIFSVSLDAIENTDILSAYIQKNITQVNELFKSFEAYSKANK